MLYNPLHYYDDLKVDLYNSKYCDMLTETILLWCNRRYIEQSMTSISWQESD